MAECRPSFHVTKQRRLIFTEFYVREGQAENLLSESSSTALGLVQFRGTINVINNTSIADMISRYTDRFEGIGEMKDTQVKLHIDKTVKPVE